MEGNNEKQPNAGEALSQIAIFEQQAQVMGANDYEPSAFNVVRKKLYDGDITPQEAIAEAQAILDNKQDYH